MQRRTKKRILWTSGILAGLLLLVVLAHNLIVSRFRPELSANLKEKVHTATDRLYRLEFDKIRLNLLRGQAQVLNVRLIPDTGVYDSLRSAGKDIHTLFRVNSDKITVQGVNILKVFGEKKLDINLLHIEKPKITIRKDTLAAGAVADTTSAGFNAWELIHPTLNALSIRKVLLEDGFLDYQKRSGEKSGTRLEFTGLQLSADDLHIDSAANSRENPFYSEDLRLSTGSFSYFTPDSLYTLHVGSAGFSSKEAAVQINSLWLEPRYKEMEFQRVAGKKIDRTEVKIEMVRASGIDLDAFIRDRDLIMQKAVIENADVNNFLYNYDYNKPYQDLPHVKLLNLTKRVHVDHLEIRQANIIHRERLAGFTSTGHVDFNRIDADFRNITNIPEAIDTNGVLTADVKAYLMDIGEMDVRFEFPLAQPENAFQVKGSIGQMPLRAINPILVPATFIQVRSGTIDQMDFAFSANSSVSSGSMQFYYSNLRVKILSQDQERRNRWLLTKLTNILVINSDNPLQGEALTPGVIRFQRIPNRSVFNYLWKSLLEGIKTSVGLSPDRQKHLNSLIKDFGSLKQNDDKSGKQLKGFFN